MLIGVAIAVYAAKDVSPYSFFQTAVKRHYSAFRFTLIKIRAHNKNAREQLSARLCVILHRPHLRCEIPGHMTELHFCRTITKGERGDAGLVDADALNARSETRL